MLFHYAWLFWSLAFFAVWTIIYYFKTSLRHEMLIVSSLTMPLGLTEPLFVPEYWNPPTLFDLAQRTGFDIESLIFCFSIGGVGSVTYRFFTKQSHKRVCEHVQNLKKHRFHFLLLTSPIYVFIIFLLFTDLNHIYCGIVAMLVGAVATVICRPDLLKNTLIGGGIFLGYYFLFFMSLVFFVPEYVSQVWNNEALSKIVIFGVPLEEYLFAFSFGAMWAGLFEHIFWKKLA